ncbi:MAG TPA: biotin--[acetyl-CoA-carboxylase] ligase [Tepidisphaeraceae bacterium]|nr:biotin--[acetyl-CoA-carboxylase] ligase [Tepidisphaeraceae bacterium]
MPITSFNLSELRTQIKPFRLHWFPRLRSTNDHAAVLRKRGRLYAPAMVLTGHQLAGRGRGAHAWWSGPGCLTVTFVLPVETHLAPHQVPLLAGLAVRNAAAQLAGDAQVALKWPNDVLYDGRKLAGLLCERVHNADLVGLGLNVNIDPRRAPGALREHITSLSLITGRTLSITGALVTVAHHLKAALLHRDERLFSHFLQEYDTHHALIGRRVTIINNGEGVPVIGRCEGLDANGRLLLRNRKTLHRIVAGQVQLL